MGAFGGLNQAQENGKLPWLTKGFNGDVEIDRMVYKLRRVSNEPVVVTEFTVLATNDPVLHPVGCKRSWYQSMKEQQTGFGALKGYLYGVAGIGKNDAQGRAAIDGKAEELMDAAVSEAQILAKKRVHVQADEIDTKSKNPDGTAKKFTLYTWSPYQAAQVAQAA